MIKQYNLNIFNGFVSFRYTRMSPERFQHLLGLVEPLITKKPCRSREVITPHERLMVTLRYLAEGEAQQSQAFNFRMGKATVSNIVRETCDAIWTALHSTYLKTPNSPEEWKKIADCFEEEWNFPHCLGAIDGKHIMIECPKNAGSAYYNYKNFHSIVLLAICDANYCFTFVDIGDYGSTNDASVLSNSAFGQAFEKGPETLETPSPCNYKDVQKLPFVLIGDDIFPQKSWLMKPFPGKGLHEHQRVYNYRLSRARRTIENAFGILSAKWRIFRKPIKANVDLVDKITKASVCLHNYLRLTENATYTPAGFIDNEDSTGNILPGDWRNAVANDGGLNAIGRVGGNRYTVEASDARDAFKAYFNSADGLNDCPWQLQYVRSCGSV